MKRFIFYTLAFFVLAAAVWFYGYSKGFFSGPETSENLSEISNTVQLGEVQSGLVALSETFARQLAVRGYEFGNFSEVPEWLNLVGIEAAGDTARVEILKDGAPFLTVFELQLPFGISYDELIDGTRGALGTVALTPAAFGPDSFYFLQENLSTNILSLGGSALAFQFDSANFTEVRDFIATLVILN